MCCWKSICQNKSSKYKTNLLKFQTYNKINQSITQLKKGEWVENAEKAQDSPVNININMFNLATKML